MWSNPLKPRTEWPPIGIDAGARTRFTLSSGHKISRRSQALLRRLQQRLPATKRGSYSRNKKRAMVAGERQRVRQAECGHMHELTRVLVDHHGARFFVEHLAVREMTAKGGSQKTNLHRSIRVQAWAAFCELLTFKAAEVPPHNASRHVRIDGRRTVCNVLTKSRHNCI